MTQSILITGASSGIGLAAAHHFLNRGCSVTGIARNFSAVECDDLKAHEIDLADLDSLPTKLAVFDSPFDVLLLNAGYGRFGGIEQFSHAQIRHLVDTNLVSNLFLVKHFLPMMKAKGAGDIVLLGSESALQGARAGSVYCATKFALRGLAQSLRADCANSDVRVILVNPGPVDTDFFCDLNFAPHAGDQFVIEPDAVVAAIVHALDQPRNVVTEEINLQPLKRSFQKKGGAEKGAQKK